MCKKKKKKKTTNKTNDNNNNFKITLLEFQKNPNFSEIDTLLQNSIIFPKAKTTYSELMLELTKAVGVLDLGFWPCA